MSLRPKPVGCGLIASALLVTLVGSAQRVDPKRARTVIVGAPGGLAPADRVDSARTGASRVALPTGNLHVAWKRSLGVALESAPLVARDGSITLVGVTGEIVVLGADGEERAHTLVGARAWTPATLLADDTAAFLAASGDAVGVRLGGVRFRTRVAPPREPGGANDHPLPAPLALDDGGFVLATHAELVALDAGGDVRARTALETSDPVLQLVQPVAGGDVYAITEGGAVLAWLAGTGRDVARVASFGGPVDNGVASLPGPALAAVVGRAQLVVVDLAHGTSTIARAATEIGAIAFLGPPAAIRTTAGAEEVALLALTPVATLAVAVDLASAGAEPLHQRIGRSLLTSFVDGGVSPAGNVPKHVGPLVDARGAVFFALPPSPNDPADTVGAVAPSGAVDTLGNLCQRFGKAAPSIPTSTGPAPFTGLAPAAPDAVVVACGGGVAARVESDFARAP